MCPFGTGTELCRSCRRGGLQFKIEVESQVLKVGQPLDKPRATHTHPTRPTSTARATTTRRTSTPSHIAHSGAMSLPPPASEPTPHTPSGGDDSPGLVNPDPRDSDAEVLWSGFVAETIGDADADTESPLVDLLQRHPDMFVKEVLTHSLIHSLTPPPSVTPSRPHSLTPSHPHTLYHARTHSRTHRYWSGWTPWPARCSRRWAGLGTLRCWQAACLASYFGCGKAWHIVFAGHRIPSYSSNEGSKHIG